MEKIKEKLTSKNILILIFILACIFRIIFISFSRIDQYQYDVGTMNLNSSESYDKLLKKDESVFLKNRHLDYILTIYETGKLPTENYHQFYHPPLYHIVSAGWLKCVDLLEISSEAKLESLQIVTCIYSIITLLIIWKILEELNIDDKFKILVIAICGFHPLFIYTSGLINNDMLLTMFSVLSILYILKWYKNPNFKDAIILAIVIGLGTLTKTSMLVNVFISGIAFLIKFLGSIDKQEYKKMRKIICQGAVFFIISIPLIISFPIRNYIMFEQDFFSIHDAAEWLYVGNEKITERFGIFSNEILDNRLKYQDKNILSYVIESAIVFETERDSVIGTTLLKILSIIFIVISLVAMIKNLFLKDKKNYILVSGYIMWILFFITFNYQMPNSCSMHSRYIITAIILSVICMAESMRYNKKDIFVKTITILTVLFCIISSIVVMLNIIYY